MSSMNKTKRVWYPGTPECRPYYAYLSTSSKRRRSSTAFEQVARSRKQLPPSHKRQHISITRKKSRRSSSGSSAAFRNMWPVPVNYSPQLTKHHITNSSSSNRSRTRSSRNSYCPHPKQHHTTVVAEIKVGGRGETQQKHAHFQHVAAISARLLTPGYSAKGRLVGCI